ncbi:MAG: nicotinamide-nucleotide adenylyltransferase [Thermoplasmatota archaeon]
MVGRFQPIHRGHLMVLRSLAGRFESFVIVIGSAQYSHTLENPFTAGERVEMVAASLFSEGCTNFYVVPVEDIHEHSRWVARVESLVPRFSAVVTNNPLTSRLFQERGIEVLRTPLYDRRRLSGTHIRGLMLRGARWRHLVPEPAVEVIDGVGGVERLRQLARRDE